MEWRNQVAVVTGGSRGIGRATARLLSQRGAAVCVNYAVNSDAAKALPRLPRRADGLSRWRQTLPTRPRSRRCHPHRGGTGPGDHLGEQRRRELAGHAGHVRQGAGRAHTLHFSGARRAGDCEADQTFEAKWPGNNAVPIGRADERQRDIEGAIR